MSAYIHPTANVDRLAILAEGVTIGPYAVVEAGASLGAGCHVAAHAIIRAFSILEARVSVDSFAVLGGLPQDLSFGPEIESCIRVGEGTVIREGVTINRSTRASGETLVGKNCMLMANAHVGHDCQLGDGVIVANNVMLAGHVWVGEQSFLGGGCGIHQFVRIGALAMIAGNASVTYDVPAYVTVAERSLVTGLNLVGLKRHLSKEAITDLRACYKAVYMHAGNPVKLAAEAKAATEEGRRFLADFTAERPRGRFSRSRIQTR
jgi:UDP-N-acetylglucosamine acyltransferase